MVVAILLLAPEGLAADFWLISKTVKRRNTILHGFELLAKVLIIKTLDSAVRIIGIEYPRRLSRFLRADPI